MTYIEEYLESVETKLDSCITAIELLFEKQTDQDAKLKAMDEKIAQQEDQSRRNNLIFYGIPEGSENDSWKKVENDVRHFLKDTMHINNADDPDKLIIERAHRLGMKRQGQTRPTIARFLNWNQKSDIFMKARDIPRDSSIRIGEDFSYRVRAMRKILYPKLQEAKGQGKRASLRFDKLFIDNVVYVVDGNNQIIPAR